MDFDSGSVKHRVTTFDTKHGGRENSVQSEGGWIYYKDGAKRETEPLGALVEPPTDGYELAVAKLNYARTVLKRGNDEFANLREQLRFTLRDDVGLAKLKRLKSALPKLQQEVTWAEAAVNATEQGRRIQSERQSLAEERARIAAWKSEVESVAAGVGAEE
jgi:hypothetical protein